MERLNERRTDKKKTKKINEGRKQKIQCLRLTFIIKCISKFLAALIYPGWTVGRARIVSQLRAHTRERMLSKLGVEVGLTHLNITLKCKFF